METSMKKSIVTFTLVMVFCIAGSFAFAEKQKLKAIYGGAVYNGYNFPLYLGAKNIYGNSDNSIEYIISSSNEKRAIATLEKVKKFYNRSNIVKKMGGNRINIKAPFNRAPVEMADVFISASGENEIGKGYMVVLRREAKIIKVYVFIVNDPKLVQPLMN